MPMSAADAKRVGYTLGMILTPGLATGYPDLVRMANRIYTDKVAKLPWVPPSWLAAVKDLQAKYPGDLVRPAPAFDALGRRGEYAPSWADTDEKLTAWGVIWQSFNDAQVAYAKKQAEIGADELRRLEADAAFWDGAYRLAVTVRDLPSNVVKAVGGGVSDFVGTFLPESLKAYAKWVTLALVLLIVGAVLVWYRKRLAGLFRGLRGGA